MCRLCGAGVESVGHVLSACQVLSWGAYKERHDRVLYLLVQSTLEALELPLPAEYKGPGGLALPGILGDENKMISVDKPVVTSRPVTECRPDLYVRVRKLKKILILDVACAWDL